MKSEEKAIAGVSALINERDSALAEAAKMRARSAQAEFAIGNALARIRELEEQLYAPTAAAIHRYTECSVETYHLADAEALRVTPLCASVLIHRNVLRDAQAPYSVVCAAIDSMAEKIADGYRKQFHELMQKRFSSYRGRR